MITVFAPRGMNDLFEPELSLWRRIEALIHHNAKIFGFSEIRTPVMEDLALFKRGIGETTDIVEKEMFVIPDGDNNYCLRPENTASVVRALIQRGGLSPDTEEKLYYLGPMFRKERPQKGRLRQFHQFGFESFGSLDPLADVEIMVLVDQLFKQLKLSHIVLKINSLGVGDERNTYREKLLLFLHDHIENLCTDCKRRITLNPLRVLDCKNPQCGEISSKAPKTIDSLGPDSLKHFEDVCAGLSHHGVSFVVDNSLVRGLDYYERTVFEFVATSGLGAQNAIAAGGRYDGLFKVLGHKANIPAIGVAGGIERLVMLLDMPTDLPKNLIAFISADDNGYKTCTDLAFKLRQADISADFCLTKKSLKAQMRRANKLGSKYVVIIGQDEINQKSLVVKSMHSDKSWPLPIDIAALVEFLKSKGISDDL